MICTFLWLRAGTSGGVETMIIENILLFLGTLAAIGLGIALWKKFEPSIKYVDL